MAITRKNSKTNKRNKRMSKNTKKTSKRSNSSKRNGSKNRKMRKTRKSVKGVRKMKGGGGEEINLRDYFPIDTGALFSKIEDFYRAQKDTVFIKNGTFLIHPIRDYNKQPPYFALRLLVDNYNYVIIDEPNDIKTLLIFKIDENDYLIKIFTIHQKPRKELGTIINENNIILHSDTDKFKFQKGMPNFPLKTDIILKRKDNNYNTVAWSKYNLYSLISAKTTKHFQKDDIEGYYKYPEPITNTNK